MIPPQPESTNKEITISDGYSKIYEDFEKDEIYEKELINKLIDERKDNLNIAEDKRESIENNTHIYDLINQSCNEHEVQSKENRECCDMIKAAEQTKEDNKIIERPIGFWKKIQNKYIYWI